MNKTILKNVLVWSFSALLLSGCPASDDDNAQPGSSPANPLVVQALDQFTFSYSGSVGTGSLYLKIVELATNNGGFVTTLSGMVDDADMYAYSDAFVTEICSSTNAGTADEGCNLTSNADGVLYFRIDGSKTTSGTTFNLDGAD